MNVLNPPAQIYGCASFTKGVITLTCRQEALQSHLTDVLNLSAQMALKVRQEMQEKLVAAVATSESEQLKRFEEFMELKQRQEYQSMRDMMDRE